jgi:hypothetical protein
LLEAALSVNFVLKVYNPILTKQGIKTSIRGQKTDKTDAILIERLGIRREGRLYTKEPYMAAKLQTRSYAKLGVIQGGFKKHVDHLTAMDDGIMNEQVVAVFQAVEEAIEQARKQLYY